MKKQDKPTTKMITEVIFIFVIMMVFTLIACSYKDNFYNSKTQQEFKTWVLSLGIWGWLMILVIQIMQIIVAFIPGEPIEILAGVMYGGLGGLLICLLGCVIASSGIFLLTQKFGAPLAAHLCGNSKFSKFIFLKDSRKLEMIVFILFLFPGTPKDLLTYIVGISPMKLSRFLLIATFSRIPSILTSTLMGSTMRQGEWNTSLLIFAITAVFGILGIQYKDKVINFCQKIDCQFKRGKTKNEVL